MSKTHFWSGFAAGAAAGIVGLWASNFLGRGGGSRIVRLEKSVQIGRPVHEVFSAWSDYNSLPQLSRIVQHVSRSGNRSHWIVNIDGRNFEWDAELTQFVPNEAIGWKSVAGTRHTGRINFAPLGDNTVVHVQMNYAPPVRVLRPVAASISGRIEGYIEQALRDFKAALESGEQGRRSASSSPAETTTSANWPNEPSTAQGTGTYGPGPEMVRENQNPRFGSPSVPVEFTRPPDAKR